MSQALFPIKAIASAINISIGLLCVVCGKLGLNFVETPGELVAEDVTAVTDIFHISLCEIGNRMRGSLTLAD